MADSLNYNIPVSQPNDNGNYRWMSARAGQPSQFCSSDPGTPAITMYGDIDLCGNNIIGASPGTGESRNAIIRTNPPYSATPPNDEELFVLALPPAGAGRNIIDYSRSKIHGFQSANVVSLSGTIYLSAAASTPTIPVFGKTTIKIDPLLPSGPIPDDLFPSIHAITRPVDFSLSHSVLESIVRIIGGFIEIDIYQTTLVISPPGRDYRITFTGHISI